MAHHFPFLLKADDEFLHAMKQCIQCAQVQADHSVNHERMSSASKYAVTFWYAEMRLV
jgi:hypothetical protein